MAVPYYAPQRQESEVVRTDQELAQMRRDWERQQKAQLREVKQAAMATGAYGGLRDPTRPGTAQLMAATGATNDQALDILRYKDWANYMPEGGWMDVSAAQELINSPEWQANRPTFEWKWTEPETAGAVMPRFKDYGSSEADGWKIPSIGFISGTGENPMAIGYNASKDEIFRDAMGYGVGKGALDEFAKNLGAADWDSLNWDRGRTGVSNQLNGRPVFGGYDYTPMYTPETYGGQYEVFGGGSSTLHKGDQSLGFTKDVVGSGYYKSPEQLAAEAEYERAKALFDQNMAAGNADFGKTMDQRAYAGRLGTQGYQSQLGGNFAGGVLNDSYSNPFFGQITGREAAQSPFSTQSGQYPWSSPTQQLDLASLMKPGYGGPAGGNSMGSYGNFGGWGQQQRTGGLGGLGGWGGPFGAKNPWSPS